jgi:DNA-binding protein YbaB
MFDKMKDLYELQKKAKRLQNELENEKISASAIGEKVRVELNGKMEVREVVIAEELLNPDRKTDVERAIKNCINEAVARSQMIAAEKLKEVTGGLGL